MMDSTRTESIIFLQALSLEPGIEQIVGGSTIGRMQLLWAQCEHGDRVSSDETQAQQL